MVIEEKVLSNGIQYPLQPDGDNCGVFTIMKMVCSSQNIRKKKRYLNNSNHTTKSTITSANLNKDR
jgi:hypothetical protein